MRSSLLCVLPLVFVACEKSQAPKEVQKTPSVQHITLDNPFTRVAYDSVVAYEFNIEVQDHKWAKSIVKDKKVLSTGINGKRKLLPEQVIDLIHIVGDTVTYQGVTASCFTPRLGFVFFSKGKITGHIDVCFECHDLQSSPYIAIYEYRTKTNSEYSFGLGQKGEESLMTLCKQFNFSHCK